jgi:hypothetical protein
MPRRLAALLFVVLGAGPSPALAQGYSDEDVARMMIEEQRQRFTGECPCPYSYARDGRQCAGESAYTRRSVMNLLCYPSDISRHELLQYRLARGLPR